MPVESPYRLIGPVLSILCLSLAAGCASQDVDQYVGKDPYTAFPVAQMVDQSLMQLDPAHPSADWGLSLVWMGDHYLLTADQNVTPGGLTQSWRVRAVQRIPLLKSGQMFALGSCAVGEKLVPRVVAVVRYDHSKQWFDDVSSAWFYQPATNAFHTFVVQKLRCRNPLYGTDLMSAPSPATVPATIRSPGSRP
jgi:hypothetical protein